jgi:asparagine synthetase B (glutamine-hydrolysing)
MFALAIYDRQTQTLVTARDRLGIKPLFYAPKSDQRMVTSLLRHAGKPFADIWLFAINAVCLLMRRHVTVALSGDGSC